MITRDELTRQHLALEAAEAAAELMCCESFVYDTKRLAAARSRRLELAERRAEWNERFFEWERQSVDENYPNLNKHFRKFLSEATPSVYVKVRGAPHQSIRTRKWWGGMVCRPLVGETVSVDSFQPNDSVSIRTRMSDT